jgi:hypothetical protein
MLSMTTGKAGFGLSLIPWGVFAVMMLLQPG